MRKIKRLGIVIAISMICVCIVGGSVLAEDGEYNRRSRIASRGVFEYSNNTVVLDSSDLTYLADEIDELERAYKSSTMEALNRISTFYASTDGDISHDYDDNNVSFDTAAELSFSDLYQGILKSQSVDHLADVQAEDANGNPLYYADQKASESNDLITVTKDINEYPLFIQPAEANNLTAGTAAWIDGNLVIGNGADNTAYYNLGWADGYAKNTPQNVQIEYDYHYHTEDCHEYLDYTNSNYYQMNEKHYHYSESAGSSSGCYVCTICGQHRSPGVQHIHDNIICGMVNGQIIAAHIIYE